MAISLLITVISYYYSFILLELCKTELFYLQLAKSSEHQVSFTVQEEILHEISVFIFEVFCSSYCLFLLNYSSKLRNLLWI